MYSLDYRKLVQSELFLALSMFMSKGCLNVSSFEATRTFLVLLAYNLSLEQMKEQFWKSAKRFSIYSNRLGHFLQGETAELWSNSPFSYILKTFSPTTLVLKYRGSFPFTYPTILIPVRDHGEPIFAVYRLSRFSNDGACPLICPTPFPRIPRTYALLCYHV